MIISALSKNLLLQFIYVNKRKRTRTRARAYRHLGKRNKKEEFDDSHRTSNGYDKIVFLLNIITYEALFIVTFHKELKKII